MEITPILTKIKFFKKSPSICISSCKQDMKADRFSQQNTQCRTAILQNSSLGAPIIGFALTCKPVTEPDPKVVYKEPL